MTTPLDSERQKANPVPDAPYRLGYSAAQLVVIKAAGEAEMREIERGWLGGGRPRVAHRVANAIHDALRDGRP